MKTVGEIVKLSCDYLRTKKSDYSRREVEELIAFSLGKKRLDLYLAFDLPLNEEELSYIRKNLARLAANEPLQYIEGKVEFYGCTIQVDKRVLIPRPETEYLVDLVVRKIRTHEYKDKELWDICTGSGYIGIAIKKALPELHISISDISEDALSVAKTNCALNLVSLDILQGDLLSPFGDKKADFIVCNPPYVSESEYETLEPNVRDFEPKRALVSGKTGLEFYDRLINQIPNYVHPGAWVWFEIGASQANALLSRLSGFKNVKVIKDLANNDRFVEFQIA